MRNAPDADNSANQERNESSKIAFAKKITLVLLVYNYSCIYNFTYLYKLFNLKYKGDPRS